jgi:hypothetical protein
MWVRKVEDEAGIYFRWVLLFMNPRTIPFAGTTAEASYAELEISGTLLNNSRSPLTSTAELLKLDIDS